MFELDHKAMFVRYEIELRDNRNYVPKDKYFSNWVISKKDGL